MSFVRSVFLLALVTLVAGIYIGQHILGPMFASAGLGPGNLALVSTSNPTSTASPTPRPTSTAPPVPTPPTAARTPTRVVSNTPTPIRPAVRVRVTTPTPRPSPTVKPTRTATPRPTNTPLPRPTPTTGIVELARYWVGVNSARAGTTISFGYVISNATGRTTRLLLGASLKSSRVATWSSSIDDPYHDVVATVPPGTTTHIRYFTLPAGLRASWYDAAWGLRDAATGRREALTFAPAVLKVLTG